MLICMSLPSYGSSTVLSSLMLSFRKHNIILYPAASPPIDEIGDGRCCVAEAKGLASRLAPIIKMRNRQSAWQRIRQMADGSTTVGPEGDISFCPSQAWIRVAARQWPYSRSSGLRSRLLVSSVALHDIELRASIKPSFVQVASRCYTESACCKLMF
jgi:hypothetical protein